MPEKQLTEKVRTLSLILWFGILTLAALPMSAQVYPPFTPFVAWNPNGQYLAVGYDTTLNILDVNTMQVLNTFNDIPRGRERTVWSPDGTRLAIIKEHDLEVWQQPWSSTDAHQEFIYRYYQRNPPPTSVVPISLIVWSPEDTEIAVVHREAIDFVDAETGVFIREITGVWQDISDVDWPMEGRLAIAAFLDHSGFVVDPATGSVFNAFSTIDFTYDETSTVDSIALSLDGESLALGTSDGHIGFWSNIDPDKYMYLIPDLMFGNLPNEGHTQSVTAMEWGSNGQYLATGSHDGTIRLWDTATGELLETISLGENAWVISLAWSPDGTQLAYGNPDGSVTMFDATQLPGYIPAP